MRKSDLAPTPADRVRRYAEEGFWTAETLPGWLDRHARARPDAPAVVCGDARLTWAALAGRAAGLAAGLAARGVAAGDVVAVQLPNVPELVVAYLAISALGGVMQTLHLPYRAADLEPLLAHGRARAVVCPPAVREYPTAHVMLELRARLPGLAHVIVHGEAPPGALALADLAAHAPREPAPGPAADDPLLLLYTSGTTASPRGVPLTHRHMLSNARGSAAELGLGPGDVLCSAAPLSHLYGLFTAHLALATGAASLLLPAFTPADLAGLVERGRPSAVFAGPAHLAACLGAGLFERHDFSSVRTLVISGSACPPELAEAVEARLPRGKVLQLWGMTELQAGAFNRPGDEARRRWASAGRASPGTELRVRGDDATAAPPGVEGELEVRGCSVFAGYYDNAEATSTAFTADGWFRTGDLAVLDAEGYLQLTGRVKEVINRGGVKWNPADVEALIGRMPGVAQCAIVAVPDPVLGERACCFAVPEAGATVTLDAIRAHLEDHHVAKYKWPEQLELVAEMPLTPTRKVIKRLLRPAAR